MIDLASWSAAWRELGAAGDGAALHRSLVACWSERHRHYHTLQHLRECLAYFEDTRGDMQRPAEVAIGLWFHDAFYDPTRSDNEQRSADWAREAALADGVAAATAQRLHDMVMTTVEHLPQRDPDMQLLVDIDLSILGAAPGRFDESTAQIRREYAHRSDAEWRAGRQRVLQGFLDRPRLYCTDRFHALLEERARRNIERGLAQLAS